MAVRLKLKAIVYNCDFRKNEVTLYQAFRQSKKFPGELGMNEVYLFVGGGENQLIWFIRTFEIQSHGRKGIVGVTHTQRSRIMGSTRWSPMMLQEYAKSADIELVGIRSFTHAYQEQREFKRSGA